MPKSAIKIGDIIQTREGKLFMALPYNKDRSKIILVSDDGFNPLDLYSDDLTVDVEKILPRDMARFVNVDFDEFDIIKIYGLCSNPTKALRLSTESRPLVWERSQIEKSTINDVLEEQCSKTKQNKSNTYKTFIVYDRI